MKASRLILVALVTLFIAGPAIARNGWSFYGPWLTHLASDLAQQIDPTQRMVVVQTRVFTPRAEAKVTTACGGFAGIRTFSLLFAVLMAVSWRAMSKPSFLVLYLAAVVLLWLHNLARIVVAIVRGGETHYGTSEMTIVVLIGLLALAVARAGRGPAPAGQYTADQ